MGQLCPSNNAILNNVALTIIRRTFPGANVPTAHRKFQKNAEMRLNAACSVARPTLHLPLAKR